MKFAIFFFILHWYLSLFCQSFFLHRYASHRMFTLSSKWEKFFYLLTFLSQGTSFLNPRAYGYMHSLHHQNSDSQADPHSPHHSKNLFDMMWKTFNYYEQLIKQPELVPKNFQAVQWIKLDQFADLWSTRVAWILIYTALYLNFTEHLAYLLLVPIHALMGPIHGMIVNWCGHKYGYRNFNISDQSKNTLPFDFLMMGELYQNNHHRYGLELNFAKRWFEVDLTFLAIKPLVYLGIVNPIKTKMKSKIKSKRSFYDHVKQPT